MAMGKTLGFFRGIRENPFAFIAQREVNRSRNLLANRGVSPDLLANRFDRGMRAQETVSQGFVFAQQSEQQMLRLDIRRPELAGFVACKEDNAPCVLRIAFKHNALPLTFLVEKNYAHPTYRTQPLESTYLNSVSRFPTLCNQRARKPKY